MDSGRTTAPHSRLATNTYGARRGAGFTPLLGEFPCEPRRCCKLGGAQLGKIIPQRLQVHPRRQRPHAIKSDTGARISLRLVRNSFYFPAEICDSMATAHSRGHATGNVAVVGVDGSGGGSSVGDSAGASSSSAPLPPAGVTPPLVAEGPANLTVPVGGGDVDNPTSSRSLFTGLGPGSPVGAMHKRLKENSLPCFYIVSPSY